MNYTVLHTYIAPITPTKYTHTSIDTYANIYILHYIYIVHSKLENAKFYAQYKTLISMCIYTIYISQMQSYIQNTHLIICMQVVKTHTHIICIRYVNKQ